MTQPLITIENLQTHFFTDEGTVKAVEDVSLTIPRGETLGVVGESGSGKSVTALSVIGLIANPGRLVGGKITLHGESEPIVLNEQTESTMRKIRGGVVSMIFQEPMTSLNPVFTVGDQIIEAIRLHRPVGKREARCLAVEMLQKVKIPAPRQRIKDYPHQLSGGMRQRVMIAMALSCRPQLLIADEPTTALDVTIQAQILDLLRSLQESEGMSIMLITHDLGIIAEMADQVAVMYASKVVEYAPVKDLFENSQHPYTAGLFRSRPELGQPKDKRLSTIPGMVPSPLKFPTGCKFHPRCAYSKKKCVKEEPILRELGADHMAACHFAGKLKFKK
jgi:peptide/nickel transport system ATP-binding protein